MNFITQSLSNSWDYFIQLLSNPLAFFLGIILPIVALIFAYKSVPQKVLTYSTYDNRLITNEQSFFKNLSIRYKGQTIRNLTVTTVTFWNNSFPTINNSDIIDKDPLKISLHHGEILSVSVLNGADTANCISVILADDKTAIVNFDYLDRKEGGIIQIVHTGYENMISMSQKLKGGNVKAYATKRIFYRFVLLFISELSMFAFAIMGMSDLLLISLVISIILFSICIYLFFVKTEPKFVPINCKKK